MQFLIAGLVAVVGFLALRLMGSKAAAPPPATSVTVTPGASTPAVGGGRVRVSAAEAAETRITARTNALLASWGADPASASRDLIKRAVVQASLDEDLGLGVGVAARVDASDIASTAFDMVLNLSTPGGNRPEHA